MGKIRLKIDSLYIQYLFKNSSFFWGYSSTLTRLALGSIRGPFGVHMLKFTLPTLVHWCTICCYWNSQLAFVMPCTLQHTPDAPNLSYYYDCDLITGFPFVSCLHVRLRNGLLNNKKYISSTGIIRNFGRLRAILRLLISKCTNVLIPLTETRRNNWSGPG